MISFRFADDSYPTLISNKKTHLSVKSREMGHFQLWLLMQNHGTFSGICLGSARLFAFGSE